LYNDAIKELFCNEDLNNLKIFSLYKEPFVQGSMDIVIDANKEPI